MSAELEKIITEIVDKRAKELYDKGFKDTVEILNRIETSIETLEHSSITSEQFSKRIVPIEKELKEIKKSLGKPTEEEIEQLIAKALLGLMPDFKEKISLEIKAHLKAIAGFVITNFNEKE